MNLTVITRPVLEPVTLAEARAHLRVTNTDEDTLITSLITAARQWAEEYTRRAFVTQTLEYRIPKFADRIYLPRPSLQYVVSVKYLDGDEALQTLASTYWVEHTSDVSVGYIQRAPTQTWPSVADRDDAVRIQYVAGYADPGSPTAGIGGVPEAIRRAILLLLGDAFRNRDAPMEASKTVEYLLSPYRDFSV